jgi:hypothetical protein
MLLDVGLREALAIMLQENAEALERHTFELAPVCILIVPWAMRTAPSELRGGCTGAIGAGFDGRPACGARAKRSGGWRHREGQRQGERERKGKGQWEEKEKVVSGTHPVWAYSRTIYDEVLS